MQKVSFANVTIQNGFWKEKQDMVKNSTIQSVYDRFVETQRFSALECKHSETELSVHGKAWDSDIGKWIEGASYILAKESRPDLEKIIDDAVDAIVRNADENGYFNSYYLVSEKIRFTDRDAHELYCAGHLIEGAIAYYHATGKRKFLDAMCKYADYIEQVFSKDKSASFITPGHPELELALVKLYDETGEERYFKLAEFFIDSHGCNTIDTPIFVPIYNQDDMPIADRTTADGHCVRAMYLMSAAVDIAMKRNDEKLKGACLRTFDNVVNKRMYITGAIGSTYRGESFTVDYDLPNRTAYAETCAAISLAMFAGHMQLMDIHSKYADTIERTIYNGILSGISMDGTSFFYQNPHQIDLTFNDVDKAWVEKRHFPPIQRKKVFNCSCCPPNLVRFIPSIAEYMYTYDENTVYVHQFADSHAEFNGETLTQHTNYPENGRVQISYSGQKNIAVRIPSWCRSFKINAEYELKNGYAYISEATDIVIDFDMPITFIRSNLHVHENAGRVAVMRGPVVYCAEGVDNGRDLPNIRIDMSGKWTTEASEFLLPQIKTTAYRNQETDALYSLADEDYQTSPLTLIPYYAFANRGSSDMQLWFLTK